MATNKENTVISKLQKTGLPYYLCKYVDWYMTAPDERVKWEELCRCDMNYSTKQGQYKTEQFARDNWLTRTDVQEGIIVWLSHMKTLNTLKIYQTMFDKAMSGDVQAAKWVEDFHNSKFFKEEHDEIDEFLNNISLKKAKKGT